ncbi:MBOAT family protein [Phormidium tenue FACHB-886]|nr:MBOAT family protein [Phormidium tenue FACHB-886]
MTFTTLTFIVLLAFTFVVYWSIPKRSIQNIFVFIISYVFYGWFNPFYCIFLFASSVIDYSCALGIDRFNDPKIRRALLCTSLCFNLGTLGYFKYWNFFTDNVREALAAVGWQLDFVTVNVLLPVGISFYTFQSLSYTIDVYLKKQRATTDLIVYLSYLAFFPQLVAGPIDRATDLLPYFLRNRVFNYSIAVNGCRQILWGFFKKMVIADNLSPIVDAAYGYGGVDRFTGPQLAFATVAFALQIYCDFSAYSDIAIGTARLFGFDLMRNFAYPYFSQSMSEFWRRWHISLSSWLKDYVYIPLGGSRVPPFRRGVNVMVTFLLSGLWHGASWNYVMWGGIHGAVILTERLWIGNAPTLKENDIPGGREFLPSPKVLLRMLITFTLVCIAWVFFRAEGFTTALTVLRKVATESFQPAAYRSFATVFDAAPLDSSVLLVLSLSFILMEWIHRHQPHPLEIGKLSPSLRWVIYSIFIWLTLFWGTWNTGQFVYFQF